VRVLSRILTMMFPFFFRELDCLRAAPAHVNRTGAARCQSGDDSASRDHWPPVPTPRDQNETRRQK
jgi:hypothetical protein